ncbi:hypothetical protein [Nibribacter koreensis]|uniref:Carboxypeptidase regulatory-like domain-containing protein n=1 Tax=Nibribacter koreensis TaxID=1084519 RepID=A0ABP8FHC7_9BACT
MRKQILSLAYLLVLLITAACSRNVHFDRATASDKYGRAVMTKERKSTHPDSVSFIGRFIDIETGKIPEASAVIIVEATGYNLNKDGTYALTLKHKDFFTLTSVTFPYYAIKTDAIKVKKGQAYRVDFFLRKDTNPIVD